MKLFYLVFIFIAVVMYVGCSEKPKKDVTMKEVKKAISKSQDYDKFRKAFSIKTKELVDRGKCTLKELEEFGGWWYAPIWSKKMNGRPCYFVYCGGMKLENKIYIDPLGFDKPK